MVKKIIILINIFFDLSISCISFGIINIVNGNSSIIFFN